MPPCSDAIKLRIAFAAMSVTLGSLIGCGSSETPPTVEYETEVSSVVSPAAMASSETHNEPVVEEVAEEYFPPQRKEGEKMTQQEYQWWMSMLRKHREQEQTNKTDAVERWRERYASEIESLRNTNAPAQSAAEAGESSY